jgi:hypothetical protein
MVATISLRGRNRCDRCSVARRVKAPLAGPREARNLLDSCGMQTKSSQFKREQIRPRVRKSSAVNVRPVAPEVAAAGSAELAALATAPRNRSEAAGRHATFALENSATGRPSRKSTRRSKNRSKPDNTLIRSAMREASTPEARARRGK